MGKKFRCVTVNFRTKNTRARVTPVGPEWTESACQGTVDSLYGLSEAYFGSWQSQPETTGRTFYRPYEACPDESLHYLGNMVLAGVYDGGKILALDQPARCFSQTSQCVDGYERGVRKVHYAVSRHCGTTMPKWKLCVKPFQPCCPALPTYGVTFRSARAVMPHPET